jgi:hypothetical protein
MSRFDDMGLFWEDLVPEKAKKEVSTSHLAMAPENGLGFTPQELPSMKIAPYVAPPKPQAILDIECYVDYFLVKFLRVVDNFMIDFEMFEGQSLDCRAIRGVLGKYEVVTFKGNSYDTLILRQALKGATNEELKEMTDAIILRKLTPYRFEKEFGTGAAVSIDHIDLIEIAPGQVDLKVYGGRLHCQTMQDLPFEPNEEITPERRPIVRKYCGNDLFTTKALMLDLIPQIDVRRKLSAQYHMDLRSRSDAQIAEEVLKAKITKATGKRLAKRAVISEEFCYQLPSFISSSNVYIRNAIETVTTKPFQVDAGGRITMPKELLTLQIKIAKSTYQMGMGGLHSTESANHYLASDTHLVGMIDVESYYPKIIIGCGLFPKQIGSVFLDEYSLIVNTRLKAKHDCDKVTADLLKITVNGSFGKLGSPYSILYAPELMVQVTVTGQLSLLMLIDNLEYEGIHITSANTDGLDFYCPVGKEQAMMEIVKEWEDLTGFIMERTDFLGIWHRDVNNYIAIKADGKVKLKGAFRGGNISKNPANEICNLALIEFLKSGTPFTQTIEASKDITKFVSIRTVNGGAMKGKEYLGKAVRWYHAKGEKGSIIYKTSGNQVPKTEGARPVMVLPDEFPGDVDVAYYARECETMLCSLGLRSR